MTFSFYLLWKTYKLNISKTRTAIWTRNDIKYLPFSLVLRRSSGPGHTKNLVWIQQVTYKTKEMLKQTESGSQVSRIHVYMRHMLFWKERLNTKKDIKWAIRAQYVYYTLTSNLLDIDSRMRSIVKAHDM